MKLIFILLICTILADKVVIEQILKTKFNQMHLRPPPGIIKATLNNLNGRCCWCRFNERHGEGKGEPMNFVDKACKKLHDCYTCTQIEDEFCVPWSVEYNITQNNDNIYKSCKFKNNDTCKAKACACEKQFADDLATWLLSGGTPEECPIDPECRILSSNYQLITDESRNSVNENLDNKQTPNLFWGARFISAPIMEKISEKEEFNEECCGNYPERFPFIASETNKCCGGYTFNPFLLECCDESESDLRHVGGC